MPSITEVQRMSFTERKLILLEESKLTKFINLKYEYFVDDTCSKARNMNFANKFENIIQTRKKKQNLNYECPKMKNPVGMKMALEFMKFC